MVVLVLMPFDPFEFDLNGKKAEGGVDFVDDIVVRVVVVNGAALVLGGGSVLDGRLVVTY